MGLIGWPFEADFGSFECFLGLVRWLYVGLISGLAGFVGWVVE